ncbi:MAG: hypothetical protein V8Q84_02955 [Bilophila sp.]
MRTAWACALRCPTLVPRAVDLDSMAEAVFLETDYWEKMQIAVANGIAKAFRGA